MAFPIYKIYSISNNRYHNLLTESPKTDLSILGLGVRFVPRPAEPLPAIYMEAIDTAINKAAWHLIMRNSRHQRPFNPSYRIRGAMTRKAPSLGAFTFPMESQHLRSIKAALAVAVNENSIIPPRIAGVQQRQLSAIRRLHDIKIVQSDKNAGLVVMPITAYNNMVMEHLSNDDIYEVIGALDSPEWTATLHDVRARHAALLTDTLAVLPTNDTQLRNFLSAATDRLPVFHCLPKLHKPGHHGRPIIGATAWLTTNWSIFLDQQLQQYGVPYAIQNSATLVERLEGVAISHNTSFASADVTSLYTMMDLDRLYALIQSVTHNALFVKILRFICDNNYFLYGRTVRRQRNGIAMGTNCAVQLANLYLTTFDAEFGPRLDNYARYIDDIFFTFAGTDAELQILQSEMNAMIPGIKLTFNISRSSVDFLDTTAFRNAADTIAFRLFQKPIATFQYLPPWSCHPPSTIRGYIRGELLRYTRLTTAIADRRTAALLLEGRLLRRGFSASTLADIFATVDLTQRHEIAVRGIAADPDHHVINVVVPWYPNPTTRALRIAAHALGDGIWAESTLRVRIAFSRSPNVLGLASRSNISSEQVTLLENRAQL